MAQICRTRWSWLIEQRRELERRAAAYSGPYRDVVRAKAILLAAEGFSNTEIAERLGQSAPGPCRRGENASAGRAARVEQKPRGRVGRGVFPRRRSAEVKALACELPADERRSAVRAGPAARWRWRGGRARDRRDDRGRHDLAVAERRRDPPVELPLLDLPARPELRAEGRADPRPVRGPLGGTNCWSPGDFVVCCDEKPSIQARARKPPQPPRSPAASGRNWSSTSTNARGALCYLAAWDVRRARLFDRCAPKDGIVPFDQLVEQFMSVEPYSNAQRVFVIVDNGSAHRGQRSIDRLQGAWPRTCVSSTRRSTPAGLNQAEIYFSVAQRKVLQPNSFPDLDTLEQTLLAFGRHYERDRPAIRVEVHAQRPPPRPRAPRPAHTTASAHRMTPKSVNELGKTTTKGPPPGALGKKLRNSRSFFPRTMPPQRPTLLLSVDFETGAKLVRRRVGAPGWEEAGPALARQTDALLALLDELNARATFFVLGMAARAHPELIAAVVDAATRSAVTATRTCPCTPRRRTSSRPTSAPRAPPSRRSRARRQSATERPRSGRTLTSRFRTRTPRRSRPCRTPSTTSKRTRKAASRLEAARRRHRHWASSAVWATPRLRSGTICWRARAVWRPSQPLTPRASRSPLRRR